MSLFAFHIDTTTGRQVIRADQPQLQVIIIDLERENFIPDDNQVTFYGSQPGRYIALTADYDPEVLPLMTAALTWYAQETGYPADELTIKDPRPRAKLRLIK